MSLQQDKDQHRKQQIVGIKIPNEHTNSKKVNLNEDLNYKR